eukprot:PhF_6_TR37626/c0_g1_i2/m.55955
MNPLVPDTNAVDPNVIHVEGNANFLSSSLELHPSLIPNPRSMSMTSTNTNMSRDMFGSLIIQQRQQSSSTSSNNSGGGNNKTILTVPNSYDVSHPASSPHSGSSNFLLLLLKFVLTLWFVNGCIL